MKRLRITPTFEGLQSASAQASAAARGASRKINTRCELLLRRALWRRRLRYRLHHPGLPGRPDIVFPKHNVVVFCDGDFWHGRDIDVRLKKLSRGHNAAYWVAKVEANIERDLRQTQALEDLGWMVLRFWETDVFRSPDKVADKVVAALTRGLR